MKKQLTLIICILILNCKNKKDTNSVTSAKSEITTQRTPFMWEGATVYFLLTDRFNNGDTSNDVNFNRTQATGKLRGFEGGDLKGITQKIEEGYFTNLGINAIWMTPIVEQIHGATNESTGNTYGFHGYWTKDWTAIDPNFGTSEDLKLMVETAHQKGIRIVLDAVINHTGPVTEIDPVWPKDWVRTKPTCTYKNYQSTVSCTLVDNLPDIRTESEKPVALPPQLVRKWKAEGRYEQELKELNAFFERTGYPRAPKYYIIKWLTDYITEYGFDGYRCDTVKHTEPGVWEAFKKQCDYAFEQYKKNNPSKVLDQLDFYLVGEVYNYEISGGKAYDFGDKKVNYFDNMFNAQINFEFKTDASKLSYESQFEKYNRLLQNNLKGYSVLNYLSSHDDGQPFDAQRQKPFETANRLLLSPGAAQVYYGDEFARVLRVEGAVGDANLRSKIDWTSVKEDNQVLRHWQKLGLFRAKHPAIGAGKHKMISEWPYYFSRKLKTNSIDDIVVVGLNLSVGTKTVDVTNIFNDGETLTDAYSGKTAVVKNGKLVISTPYNILLLEKP